MWYNSITKLTEGQRLRGGKKHNHKPVCYFRTRTGHWSLSIRSRSQAADNSEARLRPLIVNVTNPQADKGSASRADETVEQKNPSAAALVRSAASRSQVNEEFVCVLMCSQRIDGRSQSLQRGYIFVYLYLFFGRLEALNEVCRLSQDINRAVRSFQSPLSAPAGSVTCGCSAGCWKMKHLAQKCETAQKEEGVVHVDMQCGRVCVCVWCFVWRVRAHTVLSAAVIRAAPVLIPGSITGTTLSWLLHSGLDLSHDITSVSAHTHTHTRFCVKV